MSLLEARSPMLSSASSLSPGLDSDEVERLEVTFASKTKTGSAKSKIYVQPTEPQPTKRLPSQRDDQHCSSVPDAGRSRKRRKSNRSTSDIEPDHVVEAATNAVSAGRKGAATRESAQVKREDEAAILVEVALQESTNAAVKKTKKGPTKAKQRSKSERQTDPPEVEDQEHKGHETSKSSQKVKRRRKTKEEREAEAMPLAARSVGLKMFIGAHVSSAKGGLSNMLQYTESSRSLWFVLYGLIFPIILNLFYYSCRSS